MFDDTILLEHENTSSTRESTPVNENYIGSGDGENGSGDNDERIEITESNMSGVLLTESLKAKINQACKYESLDYDQCENMLQLEEESNANRFAVCF